MGLLSVGCSFSGHRIIKSGHERALPELISRAVEYAYNEGCRDFYSGGALGFDTLAAREVLSFRISHPDVRLIMLLPCIDQDLKWNARQRDNYRFLLSNANEVVYISEEYTADCIRRRNMRLAELCDIMICYLSRRDSGAGQTVAMAKRLDKRIYSLYPALEKNGKSEK